MPLYEFSCETCGKRESVFNSIENRNDAPQGCGKECKWSRLITSSKVVGDIQPYLDENISSEPIYIKSRRHREQLMKEHGVYEKFGKNWQ